MKLSQSVLEQETPRSRRTSTAASALPTAGPQAGITNPSLSSDIHRLKSSGQPVLINQNGAESITFEYPLDLPLSMDGETEVHRKKFSADHETAEPR